MSWSPNAHGAGIFAIWHGLCEGSFREFKLPQTRIMTSTTLRVAIAPPPPASRNLVGIGIVVGLHILVGYAIAIGLGHKMIEVLRKPLDVVLIEQIKPPPPPPPPPKSTPQPKAATVPPPAYVPPVEVPVQASPPTITATTTAPPPEPAPVVKAAPEPVSIAVACPNHLEVRSHVPYPPRALAMGIAGEVLVEFTVGSEGEIRNVAVVQSTNSVFNRAAIDAVGRFKCVGQGHGREARVRVPFAFQLES